MNNIEEIFKEIEGVPDFYGHKIDSVHYKNGWGDSPLHVVSCWGNVEAMKLLIAAGADINEKGETGFTPLHCAAEQNCPEAIKLLISLGAAQIKNDNGELPLELAKALNNSEAIDAFK